MRIREIIRESLSDALEDDANTEINAILLEILRSLQYEAEGFSVPKISVEALINLVKQTPGADAFNLEALMNAHKSNDAVKELIANIKDDNNGVKYVFITPLNGDDEELEDVDSEDSEAVKSAPEKTVGSMAKRAMSKRD